MSSEEMPEDWAIERALKLMSNGFQPSLEQCKCRPECWIAQISVARYIAEHEDEPVDPLLIEAREPGMLAILAALRRGMELAKSEPKP